MKSPDNNVLEEKITIEDKLQQVIGVGFDGDSFVFARFKKSLNSNTIDTKKLKLNIPFNLNLDFNYQVVDFSEGLFKLDLLLRQSNKVNLSKNSLLKEINSKSELVQDSVQKIYSILCNELKNTSNSRIKTLYNEWDRIFGAVYGKDNEETDYTSYSASLIELYNWKIDNLNVKVALFSLQTFYNIFLKLFIFTFLNEMICRNEDIMLTNYSSLDIIKLFEGKLLKNKIVDNFFEIHFLEWFTYLGDKDNLLIIQHIVNEILSTIKKFNVATFYLKPESLQDILQEVYMELIPSKLRHLMGEYFSPDWIVEHCLDISGYDGDLDKRLVDPTCGSGSFLCHAIKKAKERNGDKFSIEDIRKITNNIVGFDINPISVISAKANIILSIFSNVNKDAIISMNNSTELVNIPVYIADSVLAPIVYSESSERAFVIKTSVGEFVLPKFKKFDNAILFLDLLSEYIEKKDVLDFNIFWIKIVSMKLLDESYKDLVSQLYEQLVLLHRASLNSFWPYILKNSFAPILINNKFDFVVGNPPWIAWKAMSKSYRKGSLDIWISYGIFEKNAYDKKTAHDDFGMAVTYVAVDQYLKNNGKMVFLLPATFLKSSKGGEGFRKFSITRGSNLIPFCIKRVDDFSNVKLFTIPTIAVVIEKGEKMNYPLDNYIIFYQHNKTSFQTHNKWGEIENLLSLKKLKAKPVNENDLRSPWLTMEHYDIADKILIGTRDQFYKGRKGIEPAGAKGVYILKHPKKLEAHYLMIENDMSRQRRLDVKSLGSHIGKVEDTYIYPMLGGRNIAKWKVKSCEFMIVPHTKNAKYGISESELNKSAPYTASWLEFYRDVLFATRVQNGKFFNKDLHPYYRLDNVGTYTFSKYKVLWKEQVGSMSAVVVSNYIDSIPNADKELFGSEDKVILFDSKVLGLCLDNEDEAYYVCGIINSDCVVKVIDSYAISTNRGLDVLKNVFIPKYDPNNIIHQRISKVSKTIHEYVKVNKEIQIELRELENMVESLYEEER